MKIILTYDVDRLGVVGDVVTVKGGYGRNHLIPRDYAVRWTKGGQKQIDQIAEARRRRAIQSFDEANTTQEAPQVNALKIAKSARENGRPFGSVTNAEITEAALAATGKKVDHRMVTLVSPIKLTGFYKAAAKLHDDVVATTSIEVVAEKKKKK